ncbi:MAG TPA: ABC transporter ATP-binding protein [Candidatus Bathyarchaeia archaeon]|jgi:ABC-type bacteriocin/lantibiotic exporter with double-glycine peptidase domain|nr:ABC transporter ATP-binding protein [Candidatus Bathyarchaeia archaeon]
MQAKWFFRQLRPLLPAYFLSVVLVVLSSFMFLLDPLLMKWLIDRVLPKKDFHLLLIAALGFFALYISRLGFFTLSQLINFKTIQKLVLRMRLNILEQMNKLSADYHETTPVGERLYRVEQDVDQVAEVGSNLVPFVLQTGFKAVFVMGTMLTLDYRLTCMVLPLMPLFFVFRKKFEKPLRRASDAVQEKAAKETSFLQEHLASVIQVQLLHKEKSQKQAFEERAVEHMKALNHRELVEVMFSACYMAIIALGTIAILGYGGYQVFTGALTIGGVVAFYSYVGALFDPLGAAIHIYSQLTRLNTNIRRILEVTERAPSVPEMPGAVNFPSPVRGYVELDRVCFSYRDTTPVLNGIHLRLDAGEKVALVGMSGSGKSTIAKLIARVYDVNSGSVFVDGMDVRNVRLESLRTKVCYLLQDAVLFDRTLKENLLLGKPTATTKELQKAVEIADMKDLLRRLPQGWETPVGQRGNALSGGERQRVALARAVLQDPSILLLDESTSALDAPSERRVFLNLAEHFQNRTIVFVSHRIAALKWVDRIVVLNGGVIEEQGTHDELISNGGLYMHLHNAPAAFFNTGSFSQLSTDI